MACIRKQGIDPEEAMNVNAYLLVPGVGLVNSNWEPVPPVQYWQPKTYYNRWRDRHPITLERLDEE